MKARLSNIILILVVFIALCSCNGFRQPSTEFHLTFSEEASPVPISGRVLLILSSDTLIDPDIPSPMHPFITFGMNFKNWNPGEKLILNKDNVDSFMSTIDKLQGHYSLRAIVKTDSTSSLYYEDGIRFSDKIIFNTEPGKVNIIEINVNSVLTGFGFKERENVVLLKLQSKLLSNFYNFPTYIEASVILPASYSQDTSNYYPTVFVMPGWGATHAAPTHGNSQQNRYGMSGYGTDKIFVFLNQDCKYGYHVFADSENNGPRAKSFVTELIPYIETNYRVVKDANARFLLGQSSGGWAALWLQINYPETFGMVWAGSPDPLDFRDFIGHNLYSKDANLFYNTEGKLTPAIRTTTGRFTNKNWSEMESAMGVGQYQSFEAVFSKRNVNHDPEQFFDRKTGKVFSKTIENWKKFDLNLIIRDRSEELREQLANKINIVVAENDDYYLDQSVKLFKQTLEELGFKANIMLLKEGGHNIWNDDIRKEMHEQMDEIFSKIIQ